MGSLRSFLSPSDSVLPGVPLDFSARPYPRVRVQLPAQLCSLGIGSHSICQVCSSSRAQGQASEASYGPDGGQSVTTYSVLSTPACEGKGLGLLAQSFFGRE